MQGTKRRGTLVVINMFVYYLVHRKLLQSWRLGGDLWVLRLVTRLIRKNNCLPSVSLTRPLSPLLSLSSWLQLLLGLVSSSAPPLKALEFYCSEKNAKACGWLPKSLSGDLGGQSPKIWFWTSFAPRSDLVKIAASQNPTRRGFGKALQWSAAWSAAAAVVACAAASELVHFDRRCANRIGMG